MTPVTAETLLDLIFREARTLDKWKPKAVSREILEEAWNLARLGPTSANCGPGRIVFVESAEAKARLKPCLSSGNVEQTLAAPVTAIFGHDLAFPDHLPELYPYADARSWFDGKDDLIRTTAFRNGTLQAAYFMFAARALGLDCGPMSGFDNAAVDAAFFAGTSIRSNFLCNLGYGDRSGLRPRAPRLDFDRACRVV